MTFVNTVDLIGDETLSAQIINRTVTEIIDNAVKTIEEYAFRECNALIKVKFNSVVTVLDQAFYECKKMIEADLPAVKNIDRFAFRSCSALAALILRGGTVPTLNSSALNGSKIANGTGYIYVPRALVDTYKAATNWSTYAAQFRALEDYTVDGTTTGELDPTKIAA